MRENVPQIWEALTPEDARAAMKSLADRVLKLKQRTSVTRGASIDRISRQYQMGSWLKKLCGGERVSIHLHYVNALTRELDELIEREKEALDEDRRIVARMRGPADRFCLGAMRPAFATG